MLDIQSLDRNSKKADYSVTPEVTLKGMVNIEEPDPEKGTKATTHGYFVME
jgi:hypothetical protein